MSSWLVVGGIVVAAVSWGVLKDDSSSPRAQGIATVVAVVLGLAVLTAAYNSWDKRGAEVTQLRKVAVANRETILANNHDMNRLKRAVCKANVEDVVNLYFWTDEGLGRHGVYCGP